MTTRLLAAGLLALAAAAGPARAQTVGSYSYFWTDAANRTITSASVAAGDTLTVRLHIRETGGTVFSASGLGGYDAAISWANGDPNLLSIGGAGSDTNPNPNIRTNPYPAGGFAGPGGVRNNQVNTINTNRAFNTSRSVLSPNDPTTFVKDTLSPNSAGSILLLEIAFQTGPGTGSLNLTGRQNPTPQNYAYSSGGNTLFLDSTIDTASATLPVSVVPVPEPATVLLAGAAGLGAAGFARRRARAGRPAPAA